MMRVVVVEDHPLYRDAVVSLVRGLSGFEVVGSYPDAESALAATAEERPDVVVLDLALPGMDGITALSRFRSLDPSPSVGADDERGPAGARGRGARWARGYVVKGSEPDDIARALEGVARGQVVFGEQIATAALAQATGRAPRGPAAAFPGLTAREVDVLALLACGRTNADIAAVLVVSPKTARNHVSSILGKLGAATRAEAVARARDAGLGAEAPARHHAGSHI